MAAYLANEKLMMHSFQDSLSGASLDWYMQLERTHIDTWEDLAKSFLRQYKYNLDMTPNNMQLQNLSQRGTNHSRSTLKDGGIDLLCITSTVGE